MPSFQDAGRGSKSSKITGLNPLAPFFAQLGALDEIEDVEPTLVETMDRRLRLDQDSNYAMNDYQQTQSAQPQPSSLPYHHQFAPTLTNAENQVSSNSNKSKDDDKSGSNSDDFDDDFDDNDDDPTLEAFRQKRLAEWKQTQNASAENKAKGHGEVRTISQDEFLPECTSSEYVVVHFFHRDFERCKIMDHHLKLLAPIHLSCKFVRIDAEKAVFFVAKLNIKTLPTLLVFKDGKTIDRLTGFEGLSDNKNNPDKFPTSHLGRWLEKTGAMEYAGPNSEDENEEDENRRTSNGRFRTGMLQNRFVKYDDDF